uniref:Uncharacterized protein n=1 Tax=Polysiphonia infestans TaxID=2006978 RepID=A0A1Z1MDY5_9FLOR|nr:hypothetical protein [Polysiphonia infestans]ARW64267.1 hypothetical protein [Polysiphonia infestans]
MVNYNILFYLYLGLVVLLLVVFAFFVSLQLKTFILSLVRFLYFLKNYNRDVALSTTSYQNSCNFYLSIASYFSCISLCELSLVNNINSSSKTNVYLSLGFIYNQLSLWHIAEYYYLQSLSLSPNHIRVYLILAKMYSELGYTNKGQALYNKSLLIDSIDDTLIN